MIFPRAYLTLARNLATLDKKKPRQANLRRAVSTAYYAVFHLLVQETSVALMGPRREVFQAGTRWFTHKNMADACSLFTVAKVQGKLANSKVLAGIAVGQNLQDVAKAFRELQQARHEADYDMSSRRFTRQSTQQLVEQAEQVFDDWSAAATDPWRSTFMLCLLTGDGVVNNRTP